MNKSKGQRLMVISNVTEACAFLDRPHRKSTIATSVECAKVNGTEIILNLLVFVIDFIQSKLLIKLLIAIRLIRKYKHSNGFNWFSNLLLIGEHNSLNWLMQWLFQSINLLKCWKWTTSTYHSFDFINVLIFYRT